MVPHLAPSQHTAASRQAPAASTSYCSSGKQWRCKRPPLQISAALRLASSSSSSSCSGWGWRQLPPRVSSRAGLQLAAAAGDEPGDSSSGSDPFELTTVSVDVGDALEQVAVPVRAQCTVVQVQVELPLGLTFEVDDAGRAEVVELALGGNADAADVKLGDGLLACTAAAKRMVYPTANLIFGGVGRPQLGRVLFPCRGRPLEVCIAAIRSNLELDEGPVTLVLERPPAAEAEHAAPAAAAAAAAAVGDLEGRGEERYRGFDPSIFE